MVVHHFDLVGVPVFPAETDPPLIVHTNAVLSRPVTLEFLEPISGRYPQVLELLGGVDQPQLAQHEPVKVCREPPNGFAAEEPLGIATTETVDHPL
jgi:hypothetical protein